MNHLIVPVALAALLSACGGGDGTAASTGAGASPESGVAGAPGHGAEAGAPAGGVVLDLVAGGAATADVRAFRFTAAKVAFHLGDPEEPLFEGAAASPTPCEASAATFVRPAPADVRVEFGADSRLRLAGLAPGRGALLVEAWILVEPGSAQVERPGGQLRPVHLPVCADASGARWAVIRAVPARPLLVTEGAGAAAAVDLRASSFIVEAAACAGPDAPAECAAAEDERDDGDPGTRRVYLLHSLALLAGR